jgi:hypothetical protein
VEDEVEREISPIPKLLQERISALEILAQEYGVKIHIQAYPIHKPAPVAEVLLD